MDLYFSTAGLAAAGAVFAIAIYLMMNSANLFQPTLDHLRHTADIRLSHLTLLDLQPYRGAVDVAGTSVVSLIKDASKNNLAIFVQTKAQNGLIVNYGLQLRGANVTQENLRTPGWSGVGGNPIEFERRHVTNVFQVFKCNTDISTSRGINSTSNRAYGSSAFSSGPSGSGITASAYFNGLISEVAEPKGMGTNGVDLVTTDPVINFWDPLQGTYNAASQRKRTFSSAGDLFTAGTLNFGLAANDEWKYVTDPDSLYYINPGGNYLTAWILDQTLEVVGIYVEEHGCGINVRFLAEAMLAYGYASEIIMN